MILNIVRLIIVIIGLMASMILFYRFPKIKGKSGANLMNIKLSIVIPARNEEKNIALLLDDLQKQSVAIHEIICVDDASKDNTKAIIQSFGVRLVSIQEKPHDWLGKSWACASGASIATGDVLLFLDADVRLKEQALHRLISSYIKEQSVVSVQPYHKTQKFYEQFSLFFNFVQIAGNGSALPKPKNIGLFGPVIMISQQDYQAIGGHKSVKNCVVEDMALAQRLIDKKLDYRVLIGDEDISFRMYGNGFKSLLQGWTKNLATGAAKTPFGIGVLVFFFISSLTSVPLQLIRFSILGNLSWIIVYSVLYIIWIVVLLQLIKKVGKFKIWTVLIYPMLLLVFLSVFIVSLIKKIFKLKVTWKGRAIDTEEKQ